jgi:hypothetical protein
MTNQALFEKATKRLQHIAELLLGDNTGAEAFTISAVGSSSYSVTREVMVAFVGGDPGRPDIKGTSDASR